MGRLFKTEYNFLPQTWVLPEQWTEFKKAAGRRGKHRTYIVKPDAGCQGKGIFLTKRGEGVDPREPQVVQRYISRPLLIDGLKFDLRVYVLVTSVRPLRAFLFQEGLVRLATSPYVAPSQGNLSHVTMHLTNYSINKHAAGFVGADAEAGGAGGSKRTLRWFRRWLGEQGHNAEEVWASIGHMLTKMLLAAQPKLAHVYRSVAGPHGSRVDIPAGLRWGAQVAGMKPSQSFTSSACFEVLGCDIMLDDALRPWLIEVNHSPSLACDSRLDTAVKGRLVREALALVNMKASDKRKADAAARQQSKSRLYSATRSAGVFASAAGRAARQASTPDADDSSSSDEEAAHAVRAADATGPPTSLRELVAGMTVHQAVEAKRRWFEGLVAPGCSRMYPPHDSLDAELDPLLTRRVHSKALAAALNGGASRSSTDGTEAYDRLPGQHATLQGVVAAGGDVATAYAQFAEAAADAFTAGTGTRSALRGGGSDSLLKARLLALRSAFSANAEAGSAGEEDEGEDAGGATSRAAPQTSDPPRSGGGRGLLSAPRRQRTPRVSPAHTLAKLQRAFTPISTHSPPASRGGARPSSPRAGQGRLRPSSGSPARQPARQGSGHRAKPTRHHSAVLRDRRTGVASRVVLPLVSQDLTRAVPWTEQAVPGPRGSGSAQSMPRRAASDLGGVPPGLYSAVAGSGPQAARSLRQR